MHKLGKSNEANALGYDMQRTGLPLVEAYLEEVLFGENSQKANLIITANRNEIESIVEESLSIFEQEMHLLSISQEEIEQAYAKHQENKQSILNFLEQINQAIAQSQLEMQHYFTTLHKFAYNRLDTLQSVVKRRIMDDVSYEFTKNKKAPKEERISSIIQTAIKDGMVDFIRDYRYEFEKKMQSMLEFMDAKYGEFKHEDAKVHFDAKTFCEEHLGSILVFKNSMAIIASVNEAIQKYGKNEQSQLSSICDSLFGAEFDTIKEMLESKLERVNAELLNAFVVLCKAPAKEIEERYGHEEATLEKAMKQMKDQSFQKDARILEIKEKERVMHIVLKDLNGTKEVK